MFDMTFNISTLPFQSDRDGRRGKGRAQETAWTRHIWFLRLYVCFQTVLLTF